MAKTEKKPSPFVKLGPKFSANIDAVTQEKIIMQAFFTEYETGYLQLLSMSHVNVSLYFKWNELEDAGVLLTNLMVLFTKTQGCRSLGHSSEKALCQRRPNPPDFFESRRSERGEMENI